MIRHGVESTESIIILRKMRALAAILYISKFEEIINLFIAENNLANNKNEEEKYDLQFDQINCPGNG